MRNPANVLLHNAMHCKAVGRNWELCNEFTKGDYFRLEFVVEDISASTITIGNTIGFTMQYYGFAFFWIFRSFDNVKTKLIAPNDRKDHMINFAPRSINNLPTILKV